MPGQKRSRTRTSPHSSVFQFRLGGHAFAAEIVDPGQRHVRAGDHIFTSFVVENPQGFMGATFMLRYPGGKIPSTATATTAAVPNTTSRAVVI